MSTATPQRAKSNRHAASRAIAPRQSANGPLSQYAHDQIISWLLEGRLKPGQAINRRQVAAELGVSVAPVMEAMLKLRSEGLIETIPRQGTRVRQIGLTELHGQLIVREALECQAARMYYGEPVRRHREELGYLAQVLDDSELTSLQYMKADMRFHHYLVSLANCPALLHAFERVMKIGLLYSINMIEPELNSLPRTPHGHQTLLDGLQQDDPNAVEALIRAHLRSRKKSLFASWSAGDIPLGRETPSWL